VGSFRRNDADDPQVLAAAFKRVLGGYPAEVVAEAADPLTGIAGRQTFMPSPAELKAELDRRMGPVWAEARRAREEEETQRLLVVLDAATPEERARMAAHWARRKDENAGKPSPEEARAAADRRLVELYRAAREPVVIGPELARKLAAMRAEPSAQWPPSGEAAA
jgi:hypothetical protein